MTISEGEPPTMTHLALQQEISYIPEIRATARVLGYVGACLGAWIAEHAGLAISREVSPVNIALSGLAGATFGYVATKEGAYYYMTQRLRDLRGRVRDIELSRSHQDQ